jgi:hypothetical protein
MSLERFRAEHCKALADYEDKGPAFTLKHRGEIVASAGFYILWPGVAEVWMVTTPLVYKYPILFIKETIKVFKMVENLYRIQGTVKSSDRRAVKFLERFGFKIEGYLRKYGPDGSDHFIMGRVQ